MNKVIVVGSVNMDITARTDKLPDTGETVAARSVEYLPGGKGLNQAVAAAKIGTPVVLAGCLGSDSFADELASFVRRHKIDISCLRRSEKTPASPLSPSTNGDKTPSSSPPAAMPTCARKTSKNCPSARATSSSVSLKFRRPRLPPLSPKPAGTAPGRFSTPRRSVRSLKKYSAIRTF